MLQVKILIFGGIIAALMFAGCSKKRNDSAVNHFKASNTITATQPAKSTVTDSEDIFSEFYKDENTSIKKENITSKGTLAPPALKGDYKPSFTHDGRYVIQISTVQSSSFAEKIKDKLEKAGYPAYVAEVQNPTPALSGTYYRIRVGAFSTLSDAKKFGDTVLKSIGYDYWIDKKSNDLVGIDGNSFGNPSSSYSNTFTPAESSISNSSSDISTTAPQESTSKPISNSSSGTDNWVSSNSSNTTVNSTPIATDTVQSSKSKSPSGSTASSTIPSQPATGSDNHSAANKDTSSDWGSNGW